MIQGGLVSVTFRKLSCEQIVQLVAEAKLGGIEWGGDVHVPHGELERARQVRRMTEDAQLAVAAYGSYYRLGQSEAQGLAFGQVLETAVELGAPSVRVWGGTIGSDKADAAYRRQIAEESLRIAEQAAAAGVVVCYEYHRNTLTDTTESAAALLAEAEHPNLKTLWQPPPGLSLDQSLQSLRSVLAKLVNAHVYHWEAGQRLPLSSGQEQWGQYLEVIRSTGRDHWLLLEFVRDDDPQAFAEDAATLRQWLAQ